MRTIAVLLLLTVGFAVGSYFGNPEVVADGITIQRLIIRNEVTLMNKTYLDAETSNGGHILLVTGKGYLPGQKVEIRLTRVNVVSLNGRSLHVFQEV